MHDIANIPNKRLAIRKFYFNILYILYKTFVYCLANREAMKVANEKIKVGGKLTLSKQCADDSSLILHTESGL